jgi:uncharacterized cupin superfamily protein
VGEIEWNETTALNTISRSGPAHTITFEETAGASLDWHNAPHRQYVITLSGRLEFETRSGKKQTVQPGDILLAEDTAGVSSTTNRGDEPTSPSLSGSHVGAGFETRPYRTSNSSVFVGFLASFR